MDRIFSYISRLCLFLLIAVALTSCDHRLQQILQIQAPQEAAELPPPPAGAWIDAPLNGAEAPPGTPIKVIGHIDPSVGQAILYINGANSGLPAAPILNKKPPAYQWEWIPDTPGVYFLRVGGAGGPLSTPVKVTIIGEMSFRAEFYADQTTLKLGDCTSLHWRTENALNVLLDGSQVEPEGNLGICPQQDEMHVLQVQYKDNSSEELTVSITVEVDTPTPVDTETPVPTYTFTTTLTRYVPPVVTTTVPPPPVITTTVPPPPVVTTTVPPPPPDTNPPPAPGGLSPCGGRRTPAFANSPVTLTWYPVQDASGISQYKISVLNINTKQTAEYFTASTSYSFTIQEATYEWQVSAQDGAGNWGPPSQQCYFYYTILR